MSDDAESREAAEVARRFALDVAGEGPPAVFEAAVAAEEGAAGLGRGHRFKVRLYRLDRKVGVTLSASTAELLRLFDQPHPESPTADEPVDWLPGMPLPRLEGGIAPERAVDLARARVEVGANAAGPEVAFVSYLGRTCYQVSWTHVAGGVLVRDDGIHVWIEARSGRVVQAWRRWHRVPGEAA